MMTWKRAVWRLLIVFMILPRLLAIAQDATSSAPGQVLAGVGTWPDETRLTPGFDLKVVTVGEPGLSRKCRVHSLDADKLVCSHHFGRKPVTFDRSEIAAIIQPSGRVNPWLANPICAAFAGGSIYGAVVLTGISALSAVGGVVMAVVVTFDALFAAVWIDADRSTDSLLYLKAGQQLQVALK